MSIEKGIKLQSENVRVEPGVASTTDAHTQKPTFAEQAIVTIKILAGFGLMGAALWAIEFWISAEL